MATTITLPDETKERLEEYRTDDQTWAEFLEYLLDEVQAYAEQAEQDADLTALGARVKYMDDEQHLAEVADRLDTLEDAVQDLPWQTAEEVEQRMHR